MSDDQAAYSSKMRWWRQQNKQEEAAQNRDERLHGELITLEDLEGEEDS